MTKVEHLDINYKTEELLKTFVKILATKIYTW